MELRGRRVRMAAVAVAVLGLLTLFAAASAHDAGESQCADPTANNILSTLGGRSRVVTVLMNFMKCLQRASSDLYKIINDILVEMASCASKGDLVEVVKCTMNGKGMNKISSAILRWMEVVKCALE